MNSSQEKLTLHTPISLHETLSLDDLKLTAKGACKKKKKRVIIPLSFMGTRCLNNPQGAG